MALVPVLAATLLMGIPQESPYTKDLLKVGATAPSFSLEGTSGKIALEPSRPALIVFWHVGSRQATESLLIASSMSSQFGKKLQVLPVNIGDPSDRVASFLKEAGIKLSSGLSDPQSDGTGNAFGVKGFPTVYVIDKGGKVFFRDHKPSDASIELAVSQVMQ